ncbi:MAG: hypothetical protein D6689_17255 [Deltaproteobacteria bacterium]|nr:MAG: hypothetical protein D6689_17255 [Deltaproteobacteria bacterium]
MPHVAARFTPWLALLSLASACAFDAGGSADLPDGDGRGTSDPGAVDDPSDGERGCYYGEDDPDAPVAIVDHRFEVVDGADAVHVALVLDPRFVDNTYGATAVGWPQRRKKTHSFKDLVGSDRAELILSDSAGDVRLHIALDYLSEAGDAPSGYRSLGIWGGDGGVLSGDAAAVLAATSSLDRNLNERGYASYTVDSPATDAVYTPNPAAPEWDFRVVYEVWVDAAAFGDAGFGSPRIDFIHASPAKFPDNTIVVDPRPCPTDGCAEPFGCPPGCNDPDGCDGGSGEPDGCARDEDCPRGEFCGDDGMCWPEVG